MGRIIIYPYKMGSKGGKVLAEVFGTKRVFPDRNYKPRIDDVIVNWGCSIIPKWGGRPYEQFINDPESVRLASNKLLSFEAMLNYGVRNIPLFTTDIELAEAFLTDHKRVYCRTKLTGHSGDGIVVATNEEELVDAPLYTAGIEGYRDEYRIHIFDLQVIGMQSKRKKVDADPNTLIRNHDNGYVYCREEVDLSDEIKNTCVDAVDALGLDFGAVDIIKMRDSGEFYILEVNTAPGLEGTTLVNYVDAIHKYVGGGDDLL